MKYDKSFDLKIYVAAKMNEGGFLSSGQAEEVEQYALEQADEL